MATKITQLFSENILRLTSISIDAKPGINQITGRNAQGKSSAIKSIIIGIGGKDEIPEIPIKIGKQHAQVIIKLDNGLTVYRELMKTDTGFKQSLKITTADGACIASPQTVLNRFFNSLTFDPIAFHKLGETTKGRREQYQMLAELVKFDESVYNNQIEKYSNQRVQIGRERDTLKAKLGEPSDEWTNLPNTIVDTTEITSKFKEAQDIEINFNNAKNKLATTNEQINKGENFVANLKKQLEEAEIKLEQIKHVKVEEEAKVAEIEKTRISTDAIEAELDSAERTNKLIKARDEYSNLQNEVGDKCRDYDLLTLSIEDTRAAKKSDLEQIKFPIEGLSLNEGVILFNGIPFEQISQSEQLRVSLSITAALNPELRVALVRDGSVMDSESKRILTKWAEENDMQIWIEVVESTDPGAIIIEDGLIWKEDELPWENSKGVENV